MTRDRIPALALFSVGLTAIVGQILLMRELVATFYGNELLFGLILGAWLAWGALGAAIVARRHSQSTRMVRGLALAALLLPLQLALVRGSRAMLGVTPGSLVDLGPLVLVILALLAPLCLLLGALFSLGTRLVVQRGGTPGEAYVWDSIGAVAGGALFSFIMIRWLNPFQSALLVAAADLAVALLLRSGLGPRRTLAWSGILFVALAILAFPVGGALQATTLRWQWSDLAFAGDSPYGRLTVQARGSQRIFYTDGMLSFETQGTFPEEVAHLPLLAHRDPRDVLLIGGGAAGDLREILKHPVERVTYVELDPLLIQAAQAYLPPAEAAVLGDPRARLVLTDGRNFIQDTSLPFDTIILDLPEPATGALNRFYTVEFFARTRALLRPGGILALGLPAAENYWSPELARRNASVYGTLRTVFPNVIALPGEHIFFLASDRSVETDPDVLAGRLTARRIETRWVTPGYIDDLLRGDRFEQVNRILSADRSARLNRDLQPISYYYSLAFWLSRFYPRLREVFENASLIRLWWAALPLALAIGLARARRVWAVPLAVVAAGLAGMLLELVILFGFQALHGSLFAEISLIVAAFMGGLAAGGAAGNRWAKEYEGKREAKTVKRALVATLVGMGVFSVALPLLFSVSLPIPQLAFPVLALVGGCLTGTVFPLATAVQIASRTRDVEEPRVARRPGTHWRLRMAPVPCGNRDGTDSSPSMASPSAISDQPSAISHRPSAIGGTLYAADLAGGCLGALAGAVLLVPILGIPQTCAAIALVAMAGLIAIL